MTRNDHKVIDQHKMQFWGFSAYKENNFELSKWGIKKKKSTYMTERGANHCIVDLGNCTSASPSMFLVLPE